MQNKCVQYIYLVTQPVGATPFSLSNSMWSILAPTPSLPLTWSTNHRVLDAEAPSASEAKDMKRRVVLHRGIHNP
jgi:hypothetical protein